MTNHLLDVQDLHVSFDTHAGEVRAVWGVSFWLDAGETLSIVGESGCGKSVTIQTIMKLLPSPPSQIKSGAITYQGTDITHLSDKAMESYRGKEFSMIFQDSGAMINPIRKIGSQYVEYIRAHKNIPKKDAFDMAVEMLEKMRLPDGKRIMESYPFELSGGMCQRVGIAMAMTFQPKLLLADEPTSALDVTTQAQIVRQMMELRDDFGTGIIVVTHNIGVAAYMADKLLVMRQGKVVDSGQREDILHNPQSEYTKNLLASVPALKGERYV